MKAENTLQVCTPFSSIFADFGRVLAFFSAQDSTFVLTKIIILLTISQSVYELLSI
jgi:hypothetical protein